MITPLKKSFVALAAPSGGGKTTLCQMLLKKYPRARLSISFTTRKPRANEQDGIDYFFVDRPRFESLVGAGRLAEWAEVHGNLYGTGKEFLEEQKRQSMIVLLDIDVQGVASLKKSYPQDTLSVFILPPSMQELEQRLRARNTELEEKIQERLRNARRELECAKDFDVQITNRDLDKTFAELCLALQEKAGLV